MVQATMAAWPDAARRSVNTHVIGNLSVHVALAWNDPPSDGRVVSACAHHDGVTIRVASQADPGRVSPDDGVAALDLLAGLRAPPGRPATLTLGALTIPYTTDAWQALQTDASQWRLTCLPPACGTDASAYLRMEVGTSCEAILETRLERRFVPRVDREVVDGTTVWQVQVLDLGCRNRVAPITVACTGSADRSYVLRMGPAGCTGGAGIPFAAVSSLLAGASIRAEGQEP
ncbi:MAG: hypothetical protein H6842_13515 [Rhodospirillaceae bacterium]|nr:hypothetical protein [Rhodospirillaceae bacterium]